jgi:hypothetical protein
MEENILAAEQELEARHHGLQQASADAGLLKQAYEDLQAAQRHVDDLYARWAELERKVAN